MASPYRMTYRAAAGERVLPFVVGVIGDLVGHGPRTGGNMGGFVDIDRARFDAAMATLTPRLQLSLPDAAGAAVDVSLMFTCLDDFTAERLQRNVPQSLSAAVLTHPDVVRLARTWRGLHHLVSIAGSHPLMRIRALDCSRSALDHLLDAGDGAEGTPLFRHVFDGPYGRADGEPFALLVVDIDVAGEDVALIKWLGTVAADCFAPVLLPAAPALPAMLGGAGDHAAWQALRDGHAANFTVVIDDKAEGPIAGPYVVAGRIAAAFARDEWAASFMDPARDGTGDEGGAVLASHGILPIIYRDGEAVLANAATLRRPREVPLPFAAFERTRSTLPPVLGGSRIMHYLLMQHRVAVASASGGAVDPAAWYGDLERRLLAWLMAYFKQRPARVPLHDALVRLTPDRKHPDRWWLAAFLTPAWDGGGALTTSERFEIRLPPLPRA